MRGIGPPVHFELHARWMAECRGPHHLPEGTHSLAPRPGSLVRLTFQIGARGRIRTGTVEGLSFVPLHWATRAMVPTVGFAPTHRARFKCAASALGYVGKLVPREGSAPTTSPV